MVFYEHPHFKMSRKFLLLVGQWPYDNGNAKYLIRIVICLLPTLTGVIEIYEIISWNWKFEKIVLTFPSLGLALIILLKYFTYWIQDGMVKNVLERIKLDWNALQSEREIEIMKNYIAEGWFLGKVFIITGYVCVAGFACMLLFPIIIDIIKPSNEYRTQRLLSHSGYLTNAHGYSSYVILHIQCTTFIGMTTVIASDLFYIMVAVHACALYGIMGYRFEHMFDNIQHISHERKEEMFRKRVRDVVRYHLKTLEYADLIMSSYKVPFAALFFVTILVIASLLANVHDYLLERDYTLAFVFSLALLSYYLTMLLDIAPAQNIVNQSSELTYKLYNSNWYEAPLSTQKLLLFLMQRIQIPFVPTAAGLLDMTYEFWVMILQTSMSYFMVISSIRE